MGFFNSVKKMIKKIGKIFIQERDSKYFEIERHWLLENCGMDFQARIVDICQDAILKHLRGWTPPARKIRLIIGRSEKKLVSNNGYKIESPNNFSENLAPLIFTAAMFREGVTILHFGKKATYESVMNEFKYQLQQYIDDNLPDGKDLINFWFKGTFIDRPGIDLNLK